MNAQNNSKKKFLLLALLASVLSLFFTFISAPLLRVLRNSYGRWMYWGSGLVICALAYFIKPISPVYSVAALWLTVGVYSEFEATGKAGMLSGVLAVLIGSLSQLFTPYFSEFQTNMAKLLEGAISKEPTSGFGMYLTQETLLSLLPSAVIVTNLLSLVFALVLDRRMAQIVGVRIDRIASQIRLLEFRIPDFAIWITMLSFLFSFIGVGGKEVEVIARNTFVVMAAISFFQGLAVAEFAMLLWRLGIFWRLPFYLFIVGQLFFVLSAIGIIDYWVDFRGRMRRWRFSEKSSKNGESI